MRNVVSFEVLTVFSLFPFRRFVSDFSVRTFFVVKYHIIVNCRSKLFLRTVFCYVRFLSLIREKHFHNRVFIRNMILREQLFFTRQRFKKFKGYLYASKLHKSQRIIRSKCPKPLHVAQDFDILRNIGKKILKLKRKYTIIEPNKPIRNKSLTRRKAIGQGRLSERLNRSSLRQSRDTN